MVRRHAHVNQVLRDELAGLNACVETGTHEVDGLFSGDLRVRRTRVSVVNMSRRPGKISGAEMPELAATPCIASALSPS
jgi:hypothetical protein